MTDDLDLGWLLAVAGAGVWAPRPLATWIAALGAPRAVAAHARSREPPPLGAEALPPDPLARLARLQDEDAHSALDAAQSCGARVLLRDDHDYPSRLRELCDRWQSHGNTIRTVRRRTNCPGRRRNRRDDRARVRGVDAAAHTSTIECSGKTVAVIGAGLAALYPAYHALLADDIVAAGGAVFSEFPMRMKARPFHFPMRNRIVAALADATNVTKAALRSGALITARLADEYRRRVFAVPGDIDRPTSAGTNALIRDDVTTATSMAERSRTRWAGRCGLQK